VLEGGECGGILGSKEMGDACVRVQGEALENKHIGAESEAGGRGWGGAMAGGGYRGSRGGGAGG
jgi:hypothetical protein